MNPWAILVIYVVAYANGLRIVCYYSNSATFRSETHIFRTTHIDPFLCTHLVYSYVGIAGLYLVPTQLHDEPNGWNLGMYHEIVNFTKSNPKLKILLAVGHLMELPETFQTAANNANSREIFADSLAIYLRARRFDGAQMEYANLATNHHPHYDNVKFALLLKAIRDAFTKESEQNGRPALILAVTLPAIKDHLERYNIPDLAKEADFISIRTLDMRTAEDGTVGLSAPLRSDPLSSVDDSYRSVEWAVNYYLSLGVPKDKINIGIPTFARSFTLKYDSMTKIGAPAYYSKDTWMWWDKNTIMGYYKVCPLIGAGGSVVHVAAQGARYYTKDRLWISYEDIMSVTQKTCFVRKIGVGGITFWTLDLDDFTGEGCSHRTYPLIRTAVNLMTYTQPSICTIENLTTYVDVPPPANLLQNPPTKTDQSVIVCKYTNWAQFRHGKGRFLPENINPTYCTHIVYAYAVVKKSKIAPFLENDESKPWMEGMFARVVRRKMINHDLKVILGVGGGYAGLTALHGVLNNSTSMSVFIQSTVPFLRERRFDGIELTWQKPAAHMSFSFLFLIKELRKQFDIDARRIKKPPLLLTVALPAGKETIDEIYASILKELANVTDFLSVMTYNFHGYWDQLTGHNAPLYPHPRDFGSDKHLNVEWISEYYLNLGVPRHKITIAIPTYGQSFTLSVPTYTTGVYASIKGPGEAGNFTGKPGILAFYEICDFIDRGATVSFLDQTLSYYAFKDTQWVSFDDYDTVHEKAAFVMQNNFLGVYIQTLDFDDFAGESCDRYQYPLLKIVYDMVKAAEPRP